MTAFRSPFDAALKQVTQLGSPYELGQREVDGISYRYYVNAAENLNELLAAGRSFGAKEFICYQGERLSFDEFFSKADRLSRQLTDVYQLNKGQRVAIAMRNYPEWLIAYVAIIGIGAVAVPLNSWGLAAELRQNLTDAEAAVLICDQQRLQLIDPQALSLPTVVAKADDTALPPGCRSFEAVIDQAVDSRPPTVHINGHDEAMIMFTSGTSGRAKGAVFTHRNCCQSIINFEATGAAAYMCNLATYQQHAKRGVAPKSLLTVPLFHVSGLFAQFFLNLRAGRGLVMMYKWDSATACELIDREKVTVIVGAPFMLLELVNSDAFAQLDTGNITNISGGGAATPTRLSELIRERVPGGLPGAGWGMTETSAAGTAFTGYFVDAKPGASGFVNPVVELRFCDENGTEVPTGTAGEIWIKSPTVVSGYCNAPQANRSEFIDGWFKSGDIGYLDEDGCLYICDRARDLVIRGGENIYPVEVENCIQSMPGVERVAAFAIASEKFGEELAAVIKLDGSGQLDEAAVQAHCKNRLAAFKVPSAVKFTRENLPVNATNKVLKKQVKARFFPTAAR